LTISLPKRVKNGRQFIFRNTDGCGVKFYPITFLSVYVKREFNLSGLGKFGSISHQVGQNLTIPPWVAFYVRRDVGPYTA
jgi:hypothetical protein